MSVVPDLLPVLSRGKHRTPKKGACFMELASFLAGEPWSDHPSCTHPLLAAMARDINDHVGDAGRSRLGHLVPDVIGLTTDDLRADAWIAREAALAALPLVASAKQGVAAVGLLRSERYLAFLEGRPLDDVAPETRWALDGVPHARDWAREFCGAGAFKADAFRRRSAPAIVHVSISGIAVAADAEREDVLVNLLAHTIDRCREWFGHEVAPVTETQWREVCQLTVR
ncbi:MAG: hypothetical protein AVDCRST_MAG34-2163 [uncultured Nocardioidaceae bacterium]|uniref:Uncharacterized protein n=1 Tax=uncultured Nocardioidaceae bacterium TaxID=253824 RepID=A0A6J4MDU5_9ACTN|nr:MAG: hypothetical protein AVDCRST_MAG34-2163 [uncultured Nocardioidaceae bacterium]